MFKAGYDKKNYLAVLATKKSKPVEDDSESEEKQVKKTGLRHRRDKDRTALSRQQKRRRLWLLRKETKKAFSAKIMKEDEVKKKKEQNKLKNMNLGALERQLENINIDEKKAKKKESSKKSFENQHKVRPKTLEAVHNQLTMEMLRKKKFN